MYKLLYRSSSIGRVGRGQRVMRRAPPQKITPAERERIVNLTTKLLVATVKSFKKIS